MDSAVKLDGKKGELFSDVSQYHRLVGNWIILLWLVLTLLMWLVWLIDICMLLNNLTLMLSVVSYVIWKGHLDGDFCTSPLLLCLWQVLVILTGFVVVLNGSPHLAMAIAPLLVTIMLLFILLAICVPWTYQIYWVWLSLHLGFNDEETDCHPVCSFEWSVGWYFHQAFSSCLLSMTIFQAGHV